MVNLGLTKRSSRDKPCVFRFGVASPLYPKTLSGGLAPYRGVRRIVKLAKYIFIGVSVIVSLPFATYFLFTAKSYLEGQSVTHENDYPSLYIFEFSGYRNVVVSDKHNQFIRSWGGSAYSIEITDGIRIVKFSESAILKTSRDSIEPHEEYVKVKGYMGVVTEGAEFTVDAEGLIFSNLWSRR